MENTIKGFVKNYVYRNEDNGYTIARLTTNNGKVVTIVGYFPLLSEEMEYEFKGEMIEHPKYGEQLKVISYERLDDMSENGLVRYLSSDNFTGIGPKTAQKIVDLLGMDAISKILEDELSLAPILNPIKRVRLKKELIHHQLEHMIFIKLMDYGLTSKVATKLYKTYQHQTLEKLEEDPYRLMYEIDGFGFIKSRDIAEKMGVAKEDIRSLKAAIVYTLETTAFGEGDLYLNINELGQRVKKILDIDVDYQEAIDILLKEGKIILENNQYFLSPIYEAEKAIAKRVIELKNQSLHTFDDDLLKLMLSQISLQKSIDYTEKQVEAILTAIKNPFTIITGGPGTGKTTLIDGLLTLYANYHKLKLSDPYTRDEIALMAPTGRAAKRMEELLNFPARTIHSHLGFDFGKSFKYDKRSPLPHKLIIIDEASMIDIFLMKYLLESVRDDASVVIVGDVDQLPSVGPGYVLGDMIQSGVIHVIRLNEIHRQAKESHIIKLATAINQQVLTKELLTSHEDVIFYKGDHEQIKHVILNQIEGAIHKGYDLIEDIQVLIPQYKGELGIDRMNQEIQKKFNPNYKKGLHMTYGDKSYYVGDKVIQLQNDRDKEIMNGDIGVVKDIQRNEKDQLQMTVLFDSNEVRFDTADLENLNLAYVISIHKSQGSEYKIVFLPIIRNYLHMLKKELIYTAITRAKQYLLILGDMNLLQYASNQLVEKRHTMLQKRLTSNDKDSDSSENNEEEALSPYDFM